MLIDATHAEETRVVVVDGTKVEEFDFETLNKRQISGNIYLAKVTRVEPSLQAAFIDYGGNRHGFLAFAEIHPDYYQIPAADREALMAEERAAAEAQEAEEERRSRRRSARAEAAERGDETVAEEAAADAAEAAADAADAAEDAADHEGEAEDEPTQASDKDDEIESVAEEDVTEEVRAPRKPRARRYKIQEVIKVRQIMLVQVVKEERGNKGAALTTYLSLPGRYCVLMPNTARGGGISRKITNVADRKKLKEIAAEFDVPKGAGLIIRTAGSQRTRTEIKRDYEYLLRLWEQIRDLTFKSVAPAPIYEEGDLIKRTIRDLYSKEIDEVLVEGERGYRTAKDFMRMIMPDHVRAVQHYTDPMPLFARHQVESYLGAMFNPTVQLKSGGYIVIGVTEALVAIDVNSGRATKEGSIEETALKTNLEAADEVARQLRLRDLAGLIVIDFIDMDERRNNAAVEKRMKDALKSDRARIQIGRISGFGLMEMSRQRLRPGMLESTTQPCAHCHGTGLIRSDDSLALTILRAIEEEGTRKRSREVLVKAPIAVANYIMNAKREHVASIEARYGMAVRVEADPTLISPDFALEKFKTATRVVQPAAHAALSVDAELMARIDDEDEAAVEDAVEDAVEVETTVETAAEPAAEAARADAEGDEGEGDGKGRSRRRRRRRRRNGDRPEGEFSAEGGEDEADAASEDATDAEVVAQPEADEPAEVATDDAAPSGRRRRRSRGRESQSVEPLPEVVDLSADADARAEALPGLDEAAVPDAPEPEALLADAIVSAEAPADLPEAAQPDTEAGVPAEADDEAEPQPQPEPQPEPEVAVAPVQPAAVPEPANTAGPADEDSRPKRRGWWSGS